MDCDDTNNDILSCSEDELLNKIMPLSVNQKLEYEYVGYIDINGVKNIIDGSGDKEFEDFCNKLAVFVEGIISENNTNATNMDEIIRFHMFSDNILFFCGDPDILLERMGLIQRRFAVCMNLTLKGGISYGSIYYRDGIFILGKGLKYAYETDSNYHHPAIRIRKDIISDFKCTDYIIKISEDEYVLDYYSVAYSLSEEDFLSEELPVIKGMIEDNLSQFKDKEKIRSKYTWLRDYHNDFCRKTGCDYLMITEE